MSTSRNTDDGSHELRPLPSVDMPLLAHDRRAARIRTILAAGFILIAVVGGTVTRVFWSDLPRLLGSAKMLVRPSAPAPNAPAPCVTPTQPPISADAKQPPKPVPPPPAQGGAPEPPSAALEAVAETALTADSLPTEPPQPVNRPEVEHAERQTKRSFGNASSFREAVLAAGASRQEAAELIAALGKVIDLNAVSPSTSWCSSATPRDI